MRAVLGISPLQPINRRLEIGRPSPFHSPVPRFIPQTYSAANTVSYDHINSDPLVLGKFISSGATGYLDGFLDEMRISNVARYTSNFTPPDHGIYDRHRHRPDSHRTRVARRGQAGLLGRPMGRRQRRQPHYKDHVHQQLQPYAGRGGERTGVRPERHLAAGAAVLLIFALFCGRRSTWCRKTGVSKWNTAARGARQYFCRAAATKV